ncbi:hypothetical protein GCM10022395_17110 [Snuella lapsa]|uniref:Uncharacterized protein n=1 Tax=Snuella lapsa TaxID=870481 RepID=A0ABP6XJ10_9FLAO
MLSCIDNRIFAVQNLLIFLVDAFKDFVTFSLAQIARRCNLKIRYKTNEKKMRAL